MYGMGIEQGDTQMWVIYNAAGEKIGERRSFQSAKCVVKALTEKYGNAHYAIHTKTEKRIEAR